ncbi:MAG TPA: hypothetical protein VKX39_00025 [Bryobacteraceae bacterium]|jgi:ABC-type transport system involved in multi-copper enzyme maturation permease subunit|nr:hypothetical protein [Bryobacteraceae bacterium]
MIAKYWAQMRAVVRLEMKKTFLSRRGLWVYLLAFAPVLMFAGHDLSMMRTREERRAIAAAHPVPAGALLSIQPGMTREEVIARLGEPNVDSRQIRFGGGRIRREFLSYTDGQSRYVFGFADGELQSISVREEETFAQDRLIFATVFQFFFLRLAIFFGCVGIFTNLFRGELIDKSLHYYLLAPIRREVLLAGKYAAGLIAAVAIFTASAALQLWLLSLPYESSLSGHEISAYLGVAALACLGYGSVFLAAGLFFRNPLLPAAGVLIWESANLFLPSALKKISVIYYLQSLCPVVASPHREINPVLALLISSTEPASTILAVAGLFAVTAVVLVFASRRARRLEINYGAD